MLFHSPLPLQAQAGQGQPVDALLKRLSAPKPVDRVVALIEIGTLGPRAASAVPTLVRLFDDPDPDVAQEAAKALGKIGDAALGALLARSDSRDRRVRRLAVAALAVGKCDRKRTVPVFLRALRDQDEDVRGEAVSGLGNSRDQAALAPLIAVLRRDPSYQVRQQAASAFGQFGPAGRAAIPALIDVLKKEEEKDTFESRSLCSRIVDSLFGIGPDSIPSLTILLQSRKKYPFACDRTLSVLRQFAFQDPKLLRKPLPVLREILGEPGARQELVLRILEVMKQEAKDALPDIMALLPVAPNLEKTFAAAALYSITGSAKQPVSILVEVTRSKSAGDRFNAVRRLGEIGRPASAALPLLIRLCNDPDPNVRLAAVQELPNIDNASARVFEAIEARLEDPDQSVSRAAEMSLEKMQPAKKEEKEPKK